MYSKKDLRDVTFIIPIRIDHIDRLENLLLIIDFLNKNFITNITLVEAYKHNNSILQKL